MRVNKMSDLLRRLIRGVLALSIALIVAGCGAEAASPPTVAPPTAAPPPTPSPTIQVNLVVGATPMPVKPTRARIVRRRPTPFVAPRGPYVRLSAGSGPPVSRWIMITGGNLPPSSAVELVWSQGRSSPLSTTGYTDKRGVLRQRFEVPGSPEGSYEIVARVQGVPFARARYTVTSRATLRVSVSPAKHGERVAVSGKNFVPGLRLELAAYPLLRGAKPVEVATVWADAHGRFRIARIVHGLAPGQYVMQALAVSSVSAQAADAFFQVVI